ncbi:MAG: (d)CMP kinase [Bacteroidales bacterium]|nr:(d)CMP kinase [Bacteroidales bacterium]
MKKIIIAVDGFSSCGKSTMAKDLAKEIGYIYIDSGAMYRAVTLYCLQNQIIVDKRINLPLLKESLNHINISFVLNAQTGRPETVLNGVNVEKEIRTLEVSNNVSLVSAVAEVRRAMVAQQQLMGNEKGIVMDGRDIGTTVFPDAELKIFVTATPEIRAKRRFDEMLAKGENESFESILENVKSRDFLDQNREESPLKMADDAILLDNSLLTIAEQKSWLMARFEETLNKN